MEIIDHIRGQIVGYDEKTGEMIIRAKYENFARWDRREYKDVDIQLIDSRPLSDKQRRNCYAMIREIADWSGTTTDEMKERLKLDFWCGELLEMADTLFSLSNAPMSIVAAFQSWLARFIVSNDVPTRRPMLEYVDDIESYLYACTAAKKCTICGKHADLHHITAIGAGRNREEIIHEGLEVMPLCREHHTEIHTIGRDTFMTKYHLPGGIIADKTICKIYGLRTEKKRRKSA